MNYLVIETQTFSDGHSATVLNNNAIPTYENLDEALNKFFSVCAYAAIAHLPKHSVTLMTDEHVILKGPEIFRYPIDIESEELIEPEDLEEPEELQESEEPIDE